MKVLLRSKYKERRKSEYPELCEQLDMLWHGMNNNPEYRIEPWYSTIKNIKDKHKKVNNDS